MKRDTKSILDFPLVESEVASQDEQATHCIHHVRRVRIYGHYVTQHTGGSERACDVVQPAALMHDIKRPNEEKIPHGKETSEAAREFIHSRGFETFGLEEQIMGVISEHNDRLPCNRGNIASRALFTADKLFEAAGAYLSFRLPVYIGEMDNLTEAPFNELARYSYELMMNRVKLYDPVNPEPGPGFPIYPAQFIEAGKKQWDWMIEFLEALKQQESWAINIAMHGFCYGRIQRKMDKRFNRPTLDPVITTYEPRWPEDKRHHAEALRYINSTPEQFLRDLRGPNRMVYAIGSPLE